MTNNPEETLDPEDWTATRALAHQIVDAAVTHLAEVRQRPVWQRMPDAVPGTFGSALPDGPTPLAEVYAETSENLLRYPM